MLQSYLDPTYWRPALEGDLRILLILAIALVVLRIVRRLTNQWMDRVQELDESNTRRQRADTLGNLIHVGDLVSVDGTIGTVEEISVRLIKVRKFDGELVMIPAGDVRTFGNKSMDWARVVVPVGLNYEQDVDAILPIMEQVAQEWTADNEDILLEDEPQVQGLMDFGDSSVMVRITAQVKSGEQYAAERELRQRLKRTFDEQGVEIPFPQRTVHAIEEASGPTRSPEPLSPSTEEASSPPDSTN